MARPNLRPQSESRPRAAIRLFVLLGAALLLAPVLAPAAARADGRLLAQAQRGDLVSAELLAAQYETGSGMPRNMGEAGYWYCRAAEGGSRSAQFACAQFRETGTGMSKDEAAAARWYLLAARQGHAGAAVNLAGMLATGRGVAADRLAAYRLLLQAKGFASAAGLGKTLDENLAAIGAGLPKAQRAAATPLDPAALDLRPASRTASAAPAPAHQ